MRRKRTALDRAVSAQGQKGKRDASFFIRRAGKRDANHAAVRDGLRKWGLLVHDTAALPRKADLLVHIAGGRYIWLEVKTESGTLTPDEVDFKLECERLGAPHAIVRSVSQGITAVVRAGGVVVHPSPAVQAVHEVLGQASKHVAEYRERVGTALHAARNSESLAMRVRRMAKSGTVRSR